MKKIGVIAIVTIIFLSTSTICRAQGATRTRSAQAAYGYPAEFKASKKKAKKKQKAARRKAKAPAYRKKSPWVN